MTRIVLLALLLAGCGTGNGGAPKSEPSSTERSSATPAAAAMTADAGSPVVSACLPYEPDTVTITGRLERRLFHGPPNFGENPESGEQQWGFYVVPDAPLCTRAGGDLSNDAKTSVELVQMVLDSAGYARSRPHLGRRVDATGALYGAHTGHHHAPVLMSAPSIEPADAPR